MGRKIFLALAVFILIVATGCYEYVPVAEPNPAATLPEEAEFFLEYLEENDLLVGDELLLEDENGEPLDDVTVTQDRACWCHEMDCERCQFERLRELFHGDMLQAFNADGELVNVPRINFIAPPGGWDDFTIGLEEEPTQECIDFILYFTGISPERAYIARAYGRRIGGFDAEGMSYEHEESHSQEITPFRTYGVGQFIWIDGVTGVTMGHPMNASFTSFATATHRGNEIRDNRVYTATVIGPGEAVRGRHIGYVSVSHYQPHRDVTIVNLRGSYIIHPHVDGGPITNFRAVPQIGQSVDSIRGVSNVVERSRIYLLNAEGRFWGEDFSFRDKIATHPLGETSRGDSGSPLIRQLPNGGRAVFGTLTGGYTIGRRDVGIYTSVLNYGTLVIGDVNGDGRVTSADATMMARWITGQAVVIDQCAADLNGNGGVNIDDLVLLARWLVGHDVRRLIRGCPCCPRLGDVPQPLGGVIG